MDNLWIFGFQALWSPVFMMFMISILIGYFLIIGPYRDRFENATKVSKNRFSILRLELFFCIL